MVEVMLSIALFTSIAGASAIALYSIDQGTRTDHATITVGNALRQAALKSIALEYDMPWGVKIAPDTVTLFRGETYDTRDTPSDTEIPLYSSVSATGLEEVRFSGAQGEPHVTGIITLSTPYDSSTITITEDGRILY